MTTMKADRHKDCEHCGEGFVKTHNNSRYCSKQCSIVRTLQRIDAKKRHTQAPGNCEPKPCARCSAQFDPASNSSRYCSVTCRAKNIAEGRSAAMKRDNAAARRAAYWRLIDEAIERANASGLYPTKEPT